MPHLPCASLALAVLIALTAADLTAAKKDDPLARETPAPANEPIPAMDFFRPELLRDPQVNPAGTHVAALAAMGDDREGLLMIDLANMKPSTLYGGRGQDIYWYSWLTDNRIIFNVSRDKLFA